MKRIALSLFASMVMLAMVFSPTFALDWDLTPVDQSGYVGRWTSIAVDEDDYGHISYYDFTNWALKYAWYDGSDWNTTTIDDYEGDTIVGEYTSIALSYQGAPQVLYVDVSWYDRTQGNLMHCHFPHGDPPGYIGIVDSNNDVGGYTSIALDSDNVPHISYYDFTHTALKHAWLTPTGWTSEVVDNDGDVGKYTSIAIDGSDHLYISYYCDDNHDDLKCAIYNGSQWGFDERGHPGRCRAVDFCCRRL